MSLSTTNFHLHFLLLQIFSKFDIPQKLASHIVQCGITSVVFYILQLVQVSIIASLRLDYYISLWDNGKPIFF